MLTKNAAPAIMSLASQDVDLLAVGLHARLVKVGVLGDLLGVVAAVAVVTLSAAVLLLRGHRLQVVAPFRHRVGITGGVPGAAQPRYRTGQTPDASHAGRRYNLRMKSY